MCTSVDKTVCHPDMAACDPANTYHPPLRPDSHRIVRDLRTGFETTRVRDVLKGDLEGIVISHFERQRVQ